jgi:hypothetical protein
VAESSAIFSSKGTPSSSMIGTVVFGFSHYFPLALIEKIINKIKYIFKSAPFKIN